MQYAILGLGLLMAVGTPPAAADASALGKSIVWSESFSIALDQAKAQGKPIFVALNMDGERANDSLARSGYRNKAITAFAELTINLVGSGFEHAPAGKPCPRFAGLTCDDHRAVEAGIRKRLLKVAPSASIVAPQHFFLSPVGEVILSVPYALSVPELEWCFAAALHAEKIEGAPKLSPTSRAPKRLVMDDVPSLNQVSNLLPRAEALQLVDQLKRDVLKGGDKAKAIRALLRTDEKETLDYISTLLRRGTGKRSQKDPRLGYLRDIGAHSPESYWSMVSELISGGDTQLRNHAIVALEQLGAEASLKDLRKVASKERDPLLLKNLLRAMASAGPGDKRVRKDLLRRAQNDGDVLLRINAIVALGHLAPVEDVRKSLISLAQNEEQDIRMAAACAMALTRNTDWVETLAKMYKSTQNVDERRMLVSIRRAFQVGDLRSLGEILKQLAGDELDRPRLFGRAASSE